MPPHGAVAGIEGKHAELAVGGTLVAGSIVIAGLPGIARSATSPENDLEILDFALRLEYLRKAFYDEAVASSAVTGKLHDFATVVAAHEGEHVQYLQAALGSKANPSPTFTFGGVFGSDDSFATAAATL